MCLISSKSGMLMLMPKNNYVRTGIGIAIVIVVAVVGYILLASDMKVGKSELTKVRVQAGWLLNGEFANVCSAIVNGYYRKEDLDVELVPGGPSGASFIVATNAIALDDTLLVGIDGDVVPLLRGVTKENQSERLKVKVIGAFWNENPYGFMVRKDSGITSLRDLAGSKSDGSRYRIGVTADTVIHHAISQYAGVPVSELDLVTVGFDASSFLAGQVDALAGYWTTQAYELEKAGIAYHFLPAHELPGFNQPSMVVVATDKAIEERRDDLEAWMRATIRGTEFVKQNPSVAAEHILDPRCGGPSFDKVQEQWLIEKSIPLFDSKRPGWVYEDQVLGFAHAYEALGQIPFVPAAKEILDYSILEAIY